jgi:hypothetical protein
MLTHTNPVKSRYPVGCGGPVRAHFRLWKINSECLFPPKETLITAVGASENGTTQTFATISV